MSSDRDATVREAQDAAGRYPELVATFCLHGGGLSGASQEEINALVAAARQMDQDDAGRPMPSYFIGRPIGSGRFYVELEPQPGYEAASRRAVMIVGALLPQPVRISPSGGAQPLKPAVDPTPHLLLDTSTVPTPAFAEGAALAALLSDPVLHAIYQLGWNRGAAHAAAQRP